jgi:serine protease Do
MKRVWSCVVVSSLLLMLSLYGRAQHLPDFTVLVERAVPAIVNVSTTRAMPEMDSEQRAYLDEFLRYFYGEQSGDLDLPLPDEFDRGASGSGFIISADGYVVTNHHVIEDAASITITLNDLREFEAEVVGSDPGSDLALLKIAATDLPVVPLGASSRLKVGEWVLAIGSPFGLQYSVSAGIVSYMGRSLPTDGRNYVSYIQTDVAINPGNSGGPLLNLAGEVIGINSQIFTNSGGSIGLSFAIPVDLASNVLAQLRDSGEVRRGWLGVGYENVNQSLAEAFRLKTPHGALINRVMEDSPAQAAGLQTGDVVVAVDGQDVRTGADLPYFVGLLQPGTTVQLSVMRSGELRQLEVLLGGLDEQEVAEEQSSGAALRIGLQVRALESLELAELDVENGVLVELASGPAAEARLLPGDVIISINGEPLSTPEELDAVADMLPLGRAIPVLVARDGEQSFFTLRLPE